MQSFKLRLLFLLAALGFSAPALAGTCDSGPVFSVATSWGSGTAINTLQTLYTAPSIGNGVKVTAIYLSQNQITDATGKWYYIYTQHAGVNSFLFQGNPEFLTMPNIMNTSAFGGILQNQPVDSNGNVYIFVSPGDSLVGQNAFAVPASGAGSGTYVLTVMGQQC